MFAPMGEPLCLLAAGKILVLAVSSFTLSWMHSVEKIEWWEQWRVQGTALKLELARVKGSGAGMEAPEDAVLINGSWEFQPALAALPKLVLADSGATPSGWTLCTSSKCLELGAEPGPPIVLWAGRAGECEAPPP